MIKGSFLFLCLLLLALGVDLPGQQRSADAGPEDEPGFETESWNQIRDRWIRSQPAIMVSTYDGKHLSGQPVYAGIDTLYLYASTNLPVGSDWFGKLHKIPFTEIDRVLVQKGGNRVTRSTRSVGYQIPNKEKYFTKGYQEVKKSAVYRDSLVRPLRMKEAFPHSPVMRQAFPHKHFRISVSMGTGGGSVDTDAREALVASPLPIPYDGYESTARLEIIDISWRFLDRLIVGGQVAARNTSTYLNGYSNGEFFSMGYDYNVKFYEHRIYAEYAFFHMDRYFTRRWELLAGAGLLMGKPDWNFNYYHDEFSDPDNPVYSYVTHEQDDPLYGFHLRTAFHYYFFPGLSLWTGVEANFYKPWTIAPVEVPSEDPSVPLVLQEHTLSFSGVRFKMGVSIYL